MWTYCKMFIPRAGNRSFALGALGTAIFYAVIHQPKFHGSMLYLYTTEHVVEYVIVALFMWGIADVLSKLLSFPGEVWALRQDWLPSRKAREPVSRAPALLEMVKARPDWLHETRMGKRIIQALQQVADKGNAEEFREHLQYLAQQDEDQTQSNYTVLRFIVAVSPILGFLGTVVHFGTALSGFSFDDMSSRLPLIVGEMGQAFNTTTVALATTMTMTFALFPCERIEQGIVKAIDRFIDRELLNRFQVHGAQGTSAVRVSPHAQIEAITEVTTLLQRHIETWTQSMETLFQKFDARQKVELERWEVALNTMQGRFEDYDALQAGRFRHSLSLVESHHEKYMDQIRVSLDEAVQVRNDVASLVGSAPMSVVPRKEVA